MTGVIAIAIICAAGIAFYLRFLFALMLEGRRTSVAMFVRLNPVAGEDPGRHMKSEVGSTTQAEPSEVRLGSNQKGTEFNVDSGSICRTAS